MKCRLNYELKVDVDPVLVELNMKGVTQRLDLEKHIHVDNLETAYTGRWKHIHVYTRSRLIKYELDEMKNLLSQSMKTGGQV